MFPVYDLNEENFTILSIKSYNKPNTVMSEYEEDLKRVKYIKRMFGKFISSGILKERLILNHIIILANVFGVEFTCRMLFLKVSPKHHNILKPFLLFLNYLPDQDINSINGTLLKVKEISMNTEVIQKLRSI